MMREAPPSDPVPPSRTGSAAPPTQKYAAEKRISGMVAGPTKSEPAHRPISSWPVFDDSEEPLTLDLADSVPPPAASSDEPLALRSEEHTSELQSLRHLVCRLLLEK